MERTTARQIYRVWYFAIKSTGQHGWITDNAVIRHRCNQRFGIWMNWVFDDFFPGAKFNDLA
jgi:hypothetical protein